MSGYPIPVDTEELGIWKRQNPGFWASLACSQWTKIKDIWTILRSSFQNTLKLMWEKIIWINLALFKIFSVGFFLIIDTKHTLYDTVKKTFQLTGLLSMCVLNFRPGGRMSSLKKLKRRLSWTLRGRGTSVDESLSDLAETLTIEETGGIKENGEFVFLISVFIIPCPV